MKRVPLVIASDHPAFAGHFPTRPIVPGVVLLDLALRAIDARAPAHVPFRIASAKFLSIVGPGEPVTLEFDDASSRMRILAGDAATERLAVTATIATGAA